MLKNKKQTILNLKKATQKKRANPQSPISKWWEKGNWKKSQIQILKNHQPWRMESKRKFSPKIYNVEK
jgi:hypothetical protein